jgi:hypothetical protein
MEIAEIAFSALCNSPWREPAEACGVLRGAAGDLRGAAGDLRGAAGNQR